MSETKWPIFVTGGTGFVGRAYLRELANAGVRDVHCLVRDPGGLAGVPFPGTWSRVDGDLEDPEVWADRLPRGCVVVHLAALTGKARARRHWAVNAHATARLVEAATRAGASRFIFVSSIAAGFPDQRYYAYAQSKAAAEVHVREGPIRWVIVRPTQVFGPGSPVLAGLRTLASGPVGVRIGSGEAGMQPIHVDDLADQLADIATRAAFDGTTVELGGAVALPVRDLLSRIREADRARSGPWMTLPVGPLRTALGLLEPVMLPLLPLTAGQLASFVRVNDGTVRTRPVEALPPLSRDLDQMLREPSDA